MFKVIFNLSDSYSFSSFNGITGLGKSFPASFFLYTSVLLYFNYRFDILLVIRSVMKLKLKEENTNGELLLFKEEDGFGRLPLTRDRFEKYFTIAWNPSESQTIMIDGAEYDFPKNSLVTLLFNQSFSFENSASIVAWQFNREFYCIIDHDSEVSCVGFLFSSTDHMFIHLSDRAQQKLQLLSDVFIEEFKTSDKIQNEMLLVLLKRLIIYTTNLAKSGYELTKKLPDERFIPCESLTCW